MRAPISFIHAADLHLDSPFTGLAKVPQPILNDVRESTFKALDRLVTLAIQKKVDFILFVGDLFDQEQHSLKAQIRLKQAFEKLAQHDIDVFLSFGNHDYLNGHTYSVEYPDNVHLFTSETVESMTYEKAGEIQAVIQGFSYVNREVYQNKTSEYRSRREDRRPWQIAMLHGSIETNSTHDCYAPFRLSELIEKDIDYWALGHIHQRAILHENPYVIYPGNIQGRHRKETGDKGCYHVMLSETKSELSFEPLHVIAFHSIELDVTKCKTLYEVEEKIIHEIDNVTISSTSVLIDLSLKSWNDELHDWHVDGALNDLLEIVNEALMMKEPWLYIYQLHVHVQHINYDFLENESFLGELSRQSQVDSVMPFLNDLYRHKQGRKYLKPLTKEDDAVIRQEAEQLLIHELLRGGETSEH